MHPRDRQLLYKYLTGGLALGVSGGLLTSVLSRLKHMKEDQEDTSQDDDTLFVRKPSMKTANAEPKQKMFAPAVAMGGGLLTAGLAYYAVRRAYELSEKKRMQKRLDEAQQASMGSLGALAQTKAAADGVPLPMGDYISNLPAVAYAALMLAGGVVSNETLKRQFPRVKTPPKSLAPKKVIVQNADEDDLVEKAASDHGNQLEHAFNLVVGSPKAAALRDLVAATVRNPQDVVAVALEYGCDGLVSCFDGLSKTASDTTLEQRMLATSWLCRHPAVSPSVELLVAGEMHDSFPAYTKLASTVTEDLREPMLAFAAAVSRGIRADHFSPRFTEGFRTKQASVQEEVLVEDPADEALVLEQLLGESQATPDKKDDIEDLRKRLLMLNRGASSSDDSDAAKSNPQAESADSIDAFFDDVEIGQQQRDAQGKAQKQTA